MPLFSAVVKDMYAHVNQESGLPAPLIADDVYEIIMKHAERLDSEVIYDRDFDYDYFGFKTLERSYLLKPVVHGRAQGRERLDSEVIYDRDFDYDYFGFKTLERSYLLKVNGKVVERPQHMLMRVAVGIHKADIEAAVQTYHLMSQRWFTHASPTLFNSGTPRPQVAEQLLFVCMKEDSIEGIYDTLKECLYESISVYLPISPFISCSRHLLSSCFPLSSCFLVCMKEDSIEGIYDTLKECLKACSSLLLSHVFPPLSSCFLVCMKEDSIEGIYDTLKECAVISKSAGGIGLSAHCIRAKGSYIRGTNGMSNGIVPMLRVFNDTARYVDQGGGKRKGTDWGGGKRKGEAWEVLGFRDLTAHCIRAKGSYICGANGMSNGIVPMLRAFNDTARYVDQGGGKRKGQRQAQRAEASAKGRGKRKGAFAIYIEPWHSDVFDFLDFLDLRKNQTCFYCMPRFSHSGAFAIYIEPWHSDVFDFLDLRKNHGKEENRARDLFYGLWIPDLFMQRVQSNMPWSLFCPNEAPGLADCWGEEFEALYLRYEREGRAKRVIPSQKLWFAICEAQIETGNPYMLFKIETGNPYMLFKDACNRKSNQQNLGTIKCSNLCTEIVEFTSPEETAVCNLVSVALPRFVREKVSRDGESEVAQWWGVWALSMVGSVGNIKCSNLCMEIVEYTSPEETAVCNLVLIALPRFVREKGVPSEAHPSKLTGSLNHDQRFFDFEKLGEITEVVTRNLNRVIDVNYYPTESARRSNMRHRPIGLGVQGLADAFILLGMPFDSPQARQLNRDIFETIYYHALRTSCQLAKEEGTYESYPGCPVSKGVLQPDMWGVTPSDRWDWAALRADIAAHGLRNSLLVAPMPTASTSQILGNNECFEPYTSNIYSRRVLSQILGKNECFEPYTSNIYSRQVLSGEFVVVNKHLLNDLTHLGLWSPDLKNEIMYRNGSVEGIDEIPQRLRDIYKTVWEMKQRAIVDMAADRGAYIDQSQSLNIHMDAPTFGKLTSLHFYTWGKGLKTGMYYLRTRGAADAIKFTVDAEAAKRSQERRVKEAEMQARLAEMTCSLENRDGCISCGS
ncbi:unnamed protein product [Closterium sp. NIES-64]|nr:unnamed protein product [Closterium sp. NIES-64]